VKRKISAKVNDMMNWVHELGDKACSSADYDIKTPEVFECHWQLKLAEVEEKLTARVVKQN
jgi:hypothetical protein